MPREAHRCDGGRFGARRRAPTTWRAFRSLAGPGFGIALVAACGGSEDREVQPAVPDAGTGGATGAGGAAECEEGTERCSCYGNGTCNEGLTCASRLCVMVPSSGGAGNTPGAGGGASGGQAGAGSGGATPGSGGFFFGGGAPNTGGAPVDDGTCGPSCTGACVSGHCSVVIASGQQLPTALAVDDVSVYWLTFDGVGAAPIAGGPARTLASTQSWPTGIAVDAQSVYWTNAAILSGTAAVMKIPLGGGTPSPLAFPGQPDGIAVDSRDVYFVDAVGPGGGSIQKVPLDGGAVTPLASLQNRPLDVRVDATYAYWTNFGGSIMRVQLSGGTPELLASEASTGNDGPGAMAIDATHVYWGHSGDNGSIRRVSKTGGALTILAASQPWPQGIAVDGADVYWTTNVDFGPSAIMKVSVAGGTPTMLAHANLAHGIAVDATSVYWADFADGTISRITPK